MKNMLSKAIKIASCAHENQIDKSGEPYILHPLRVMQRCSPLHCPQNEYIKIIAVLHDVVEDCPDYDLNYLTKQGFCDEILEGVDSVTKRNNEQYFDFIKRVTNNTLGTIVKMQDIEDNLCYWRMNKLKPIETYHLVQRYRKAQSVIYIKYYESCISVFGQLI